MSRVASSYCIKQDYLREKETKNELVCQIKSEISSKEVKKRKSAKVLGAGGQLTFSGQIATQALKGSRTKWSLLTASQGIRGWEQKFQKQPVIFHNKCSILSQSENTLKFFKLRIFQSGQGLFLKTPKKLTR